MPTPRLLLRARLSPLRSLPRFRIQIFHPLISLGLPDASRQCLPGVEEHFTLVNSSLRTLTLVGVLHLTICLSIVVERVAYVLLWSNCYSSLLFIIAL